MSTCYITDVQSLTLLAAATGKDPELVKCGVHGVISHFSKKVRAILSHTDINFDSPTISFRISTENVTMVFYLPLE